MYAIQVAIYVYTCVRVLRRLTCSTLKTGHKAATLAWITRRRRKLFSRLEEDVATRHSYRPCVPELTGLSSLQHLVSSLMTEWRQCGCCIKIHIDTKLKQHTGNLLSVNDTVKFTFIVKIAMYHYDMYVKAAYDNFNKKRRYDDTSCAQAFSVRQRETQVKSLCPWIQLESIRYRISTFQSINQSINQFICPEMQQTLHRTPRKDATSANRCP